MARWGAALGGVCDLPGEHRRALDIVHNHFRGRVLLLDLYVASIPPAVVRDLVEEGYLRRRAVGWETSIATRRLFAAIRPRGT